MTPAAALWLRVATVTAGVVALLVAVRPPQPAARVPSAAAAVLGLPVGVILFAAVARRRPRLPTRGRPLPLVVAKHGFFGLWAANEEVVWRRVVLGELLGAGVVVALAASAGAFALAHRARREVHVGTGMTFGALYVVTGALAASIAAHWIYNVLVGAAVARERAQGGPAP